MIPAVVAQNNTKQQTSNSRTILRPLWTVAERSKSAKGWTTDLGLIRVRSTNARWEQLAAQ